MRKTKEFTALILGYHGRLATFDLPLTNWRTGKQHNLMLKKLGEIEIKSDTPFGNDRLERQKDVELLTGLIKSTQQPFVLSVEAPWGFGKTTFIKLWIAHLKSQSVCLYFNAWENDFVDDPLVAFLGEMRKLIEEESKELNEPIKRSWEDVKRIGGGVLRKTLPLALQIATHGLLSKDVVKQAAEVVTEDSDKIGEFASTLAKERMEKYAKEKEGIDAFRKSLEQLASEITKSGDIKPPLIFFIDELDRCRPNFTIALLERIKHLFNVKNVVFVLAIDRRQLNESVRALYGLRANSDGYLRRFIDLAYQLPEPTSDTFAWNLFSRFAFNEISWPGELSHAFAHSFSEFARAFGLSLRAQEQCFTEMNVALRTNQMIRSYPVTLSFLATLRAFRPGVVDELALGKIEIETVLGWIARVGHERCRIWAEATLRVEFSNGTEAPKRLKHIQSLATTPNLPPGRESEVRQAKAVYDAIRNLEDWTPNVTATTLSLLSLSSRFR